MSDRTIPLSEPCLGGREREYMLQCIDTNYVSSVGPFVDRFEREFAAYVGAKHAVACASGTAAIHVGLRLLGLPPRAEVLVSTLTFIASANPIKYDALTPVLVDVEHESWNMDPDLVEEEAPARRARLGIAQPAAMEVVHILGHPAKLDRFCALAEKYGVALIEDAAEALGARMKTGALDGRMVGTIGRLGCYSFNGNKVITTGGGGMITTDDETLARRAKHLTTQARLPGLEYDHDEVGFNYRLTNVAAALGVAQLEQLPAFLTRKQAIAARYDAALAELPASAPPRRPWADSSLWLYTILLDQRIDRRAVAARLIAKGVQCRPIWRPLHLMPMYRDSPRLGDGSRAEELFARGLSLPCSVALSDDDQAHVINSLRRALT